LRPRRSVFAVLALAALVAACGGDDAAGTTAATNAPTSTALSTTSSLPPTAAPVAGCADVIDATIEAAGAGFTVSATVRSADTGWEKYADLWEVRGPDGTVLGERVLAHPHVEEQPFTRSVRGVEIPNEVREVTVAARDSVEGFCGAEYVVEVPGR
jgi:hypothetical protein